MTTEEAKRPNRRRRRRPGRPDAPVSPSEQPIASAPPAAPAPMPASAPAVPANEPGARLRRRSERRQSQRVAGEPPHRAVEPPIRDRDRDRDRDRERERDRDRDRDRERDRERERDKGRDREIVVRQHDAISLEVSPIDKNTFIYTYTLRPRSLLDDYQASSNQTDRMKYRDTMLSALDMLPRALPED